MKDKKNKSNKDKNVVKEGSKMMKEQNNNQKPFKGKKTKTGELRIREGKMFNDISYYNKNTTITEAFGRVPYSYIVGGRIPGLNSTLNKVAISSILSYVVDWCIGPDGDINSKSSLDSLLDQVKSIIYNEMRRANAGSTNEIEPIDILSSNIIAAIDILCDSANIHRIFKVVNSYSWRNRMIPRELCNHMGLDYDDLVANQANYRGRFDTLVAYAKTIRLLKRFTFPDAAWKEYTQVFKDEDTDTGREQLIIGLKAFHHIYDPIGTTEHPGGMVRLMRWKDLYPELTSDSRIVTVATQENNPKYKLSLLLDIMQKKIQALVDDADFNLIQADLEKAYGMETDFLEIDKVIEDTGAISPVYSGEFMNMFHNGNFAPLNKFIAYDRTTSRMYLEKGKYENVLFQYTSEVDGHKKVGFYCWLGSPSNDDVLTDIEYSVNVASENEFGFGHYVDTNIESPTADDNIIFTRYKMSLKTVPIADIDSDFRPAGTVAGVCCCTAGSSNFMCFGNYITNIIYDGAAGSAATTKVNWQNLNATNIAALYKDYLLQFKDHPLIWRKAPSSNLWWPLAAVNNVRKFNSSELGDINSSCFLSLWNVPAYANI